MEGSTALRVTVSPTFHAFSSPSDPRWSVRAKDKADNMYSEKHPAFGVIALGSRWSRKYQSKIEIEKLCNGLISIFQDSLEQLQRQRMSGIQHEYTLNAVTAVAFYQPTDGPLLVFAGEGCFLKIFNILSSKILAQCKIFSTQTIHGIAVLDPKGHDNSIKAAFWGGRSFILLDVKEIETILRGHVKFTTASESVAPDWILDGAISPYPGFSSCVFVTAHSAALRAVQDEDSEGSPLKSLPSSSRSILYSAHVVWTSPDSIMVAGGTVFGEVEVSVWQQIRDDSLVHSRHIFTFTGHEGSVFGVQISPEIQGQDGSTSRYLASCSDDRTIRVWNLSMPAVDQNLPKSDLKSIAAIRETGFLENDHTYLNDASVKRCIAVRMAHASRIWNVDFITWKTSLSDCATKVHILSFGEDSTSQQWAIDFSKKISELKDTVRQDIPNLDISLIPGNRAVLNHLNTFSYHSGKHIWSAALYFINETSRRLVTGGADGKVAIYNIFLETSGEISSIEATSPSKLRDSILEQRYGETVSRSWALEDILNENTPSHRSSEEAPANAEKHEDMLRALNTLKMGNLSEEKKQQTAPTATDAPNRYAFVGKSELLVTTSSGRVLLTSINASCEWEELTLPENLRNDLKSYTLILGIPVFGIALLTGANGTIYIYHKKTITELIKVIGKPAALFNVSVPGEERLGILITTLGSDTANQISITASAAKSPKLQEVIPIKLPSSFVATGAGSIMRWLIIGGRNGSIALYNLENSKEPIDVIRGQGAQIDDAVTTIIAIPSTGYQDKSCHFLTTSRDGSYSIFRLSLNKSTETLSRKFSVNLVHRAFPPLGPMIEAAWFCESDLLLYGFRSTRFVVWNETKLCEISSIECGGGHRSYAYLPIAEMGGAGHFAYTKASRLCIHSQTRPSHRILKSGGHGREIKAGAAHKDFIATGAEDTAIRIWRIRKEEGELRRIFITVDGESGKYGTTSLECCAILEKHTTGIQHLDWCCSSDDYHSLFSAGGAEEFHVWAVSEIPGFGVGVLCEATLKDLSEDRDLRIMGFNVEFIYDNRPRRMEDGDGTRGKNEITLIYSDSTIKCYDYSRTLGFKKTAEAKYTSACLTHCISLGERSSLQKFFTTSTDGHLALWERPQRGNFARLAFNVHPLPEDAPIPEIPELELILRLKLHQSSISAFAIQHLGLLSNRGGLLVATAGDDNALCITFFYKLTPVKSILIPSAHAANITGLAFKSDITGGETEDKWVQLWTVGGDQRVKRWTIEFGLTDEEPKPTMENGLNMRVLRQNEGDDVWCSVADPGGLLEWRDNWEEDHALVFGNGMEVFKLKDGFPDGTGARWIGITKEEPRRIESEDDAGFAVARHNILAA